MGKALEREGEKNWCGAERLRGSRDRKRNLSEGLEKTTKTSRRALTKEEERRERGKRGGGEGKVEGGK